MVVILFMTAITVFGKLDLVFNRFGVTGEAIEPLVRAIKGIIRLFVMIKAPDKPICGAMT